MINLETRKRVKNSLKNMRWHEKYGLLVIPIVFLSCCLIVVHYSNATSPSETVRLEDFDASIENFKVNKINSEHRLDSIKNAYDESQRYAQESKYTPKEVKTNKIWSDPIIGMKFVWVPGGCFEMGGTLEDKQHIIELQGKDSYESYADELPKHEVCLDGFWLGKYEVTNDQYRMFKPHHHSKELKGHSFNEDNQPVVNASWEDAKAFVAWLTRQNKNKYRFRLPTEAEWEYAGRAGTGAVRYWGNNPDYACQYANVSDEASREMKKKNFRVYTLKEIDGFAWTYHNCDDIYAATSPVGRFEPNAFGLYDMLGNVWEWCEDVYDVKAYSKHARSNPVIKGNGYFHVRRGGSWNDGPLYVRSAVRAMTGAGDNTQSYIGFRLLRE